MDTVGKFLCNLLLDGSFLILIRFITDHNNPDMLISISPYLFEPSLQILKGLITGDVEYK